MRRKIAVICGAVLLAGVLLGGCSSVASGTVRTTAAVEVSQETKTAEPAENSDTTQESVDSKTGGENLMLSCSRMRRNLPRRRQDPRILTRTS